MTDPGSLDIEYADHDSVRELIDVVEFCAESVSLAFDRWDEPRVHGPGLYVAVVSGGSIREYADVMGESQWPTHVADTVLGDVFAFHDAAAEVARSRDGAVVVSVDGVVLPQMVRFRDPDEKRADSAYPDWMGTRHMSALDTSTREEVVATVTLSGEDGRVTTFRDGEFTTRLREELCWRLDQ